jgi:hypothetical protein
MYIELDLRLWLALLVAICYFPFQDIVKKHFGNKIKGNNKPTTQMEG